MHASDFQTTARSTITALEQLREEMEQNKQARLARDHHASARAAISAELAEKRAQFDRDLRKRHDQMEERHQKLMREATYQNLVGGKMLFNGLGRDITEAMATDNSSHQAPRACLHRHSSPGRRVCFRTEDVTKDKEGEEGVGSPGHGVQVSRWRGKTNMNCFRLGGFAQDVADIATLILHSKYSSLPGPTSLQDV
ncbi:hypothetical protein BC938DRAFT_481170 [Jimgerdemannia flammicorona]|uniref:Uncharacterized protein n=1 Tax=Jimgerdemannia flammicorona TaxID=994334 RepID=A0A433QGW9_9FUNG|nr:hypothetical protein BC938DRAFT_481170 [Jimgerdemannia flammicorona]